MAINPQNRRDAEEIRELVQDTLISISKSMSEAIRTSVEEAVDGVDAKIKDTLGKDLARSMTSLAKASKDSANNLYRIREGLLSSKDISKQLTAIDERRLTLAREVSLARRNGLEIDGEQLKAVSQALKQEKAMLLLEQQRVKEIEKQIGLTGKLVSSLSKIPGIGQFLKADEIDQEMRKAAAQGAGRFKTMGIAAKMVGKQLLDGLLDPLTFITAIWNGFMKVDEAATEFTRITGQSTSAISSMNSELASTVDILEVASDLSKEIGIAGNNFISPKQLAAVAETKNLLGLSAEQATQLAIQTKLSGQNVDTFKKNVMAGVKQSNLQNRTGVEYGVIIKDILNTSEDITMSLGNNPEKIAKAATAARAFGLTLEDVDKVAESMLNFEDSISNELEAQLLTGKQMNLAKAREYALTNDLQGLSNELLNNGLDAAEYSNMNRLGQEKYAAALGISREQLAKSVLAQKASADLTAKQRADIMGMSEADYERMTVQERIQKSLDKIAQAFAPILEKFVIPIVEGLTKILNLPLVPYILLGVVAVRSLGLSVMGVGKAFGSMFSLGKQALSGLAGLFKKGGFKEALGGIKDKLMGGFKQGATGMGASSPWSPATEAADKTSKSGTGEGFKKKMQNIAEGIKAFGNAKVLFGAINLIPSSAGLVAMIPGVLGAKAIEQINGEKFQESMLGLATGIGAMGKGKVFLGSLGLIAASVGLIAMIPGVLGGLALAAAATPISVGLNVLGAALSSFGAAMMTGYGAVGLAALTVGAIGLGYALNLAAPGIEAFGKVITAVFTGLATLIPVIVDGFVNLISAVVGGIGPLLLLGPALFSIAAGLGAVGAAGLMSLPGIGALAIVSKIAPSIVSAGGKTAGAAKGKAEEGSMAAVAQKLDVLIELAKKGTVVMLDGKVLATSNAQNQKQVLSNQR
jgi:hypothetical protein